MPPIFCLIVQTDYYNGHPRHFADEFPDYLGKIQLCHVSTYEAKEAFPWKNTHWNDILFDKCRQIMKLDTNKQNHSRNFYRYPTGSIQQCPHWGRTIPSHHTCVIICHIQLNNCVFLQQSSAVVVHWQYFSFVFGIPQSSHVSWQWQFKLNLILLGRMSSSQLISIEQWHRSLFPRCIIATSHVSNHWLQAMFTWHWASGCWLCLHLKIDK